MGELEDNLKAFNKQLPRLLERDEGRFAAGRLGDEFKCWDTYNNAIPYAYQK
jgi:hypothetical protein